jgi:tRNA (adenine57-N1/adenine58-N1)-methyltransferase
LVEKKVYKEGKLVHRTEPEVKTHTSYLVFAVLPQEWTAEDEAKARQKVGGADTKQRMRRLMRVGRWL